MISVEIVKMAECHIKGIAEVEKLCFSTPWTENGLKEELSNSYARFFVALSSGAVAGYIGAHNIVGEVYITNVAVSPDFRRKGVARSLVSFLLDFSEAENADFVTLEVRESNEAAQSLYKKAGFQVVGMRKDFYELPKENAVLMTKYLKEQAI